MEESRSTNLIRFTSKDSLISAVSHVGNWEISDRCQIGEKIGSIAFIGSTLFAPGEWIGIILDEPLGKNDGSCKPYHGLFCKASKLERVQLSSPMIEASQNNEFCKEYGMEIGDRVLVSGGKYGILRFLGETDFKEGIWAGIELDQPVGKNDGSVQGKRYFTCRPPYGLFAAASKVVRVPYQNTPKIKIRHTKTSALRLRFGSQESLSSIGASSVASSRLSKFNSNTPRQIQRPFILSAARGQEDLFKTLKDSLKEKEIHLEQMIRERDLERHEMAALSNRCEEIAAQTAQLEKAKNSVDQECKLINTKLTEVSAKLKVAEDTIRDLTMQLKEKNDAFDDLAFRHDEETITNAELMERISELEKAKKGSLKNEDENAAMTLKNEIANINEELQLLKKQYSDVEQERILECAEANKIFSVCQQNFAELLQLVSPEDTESVIQNETGVTSNNEDSSIRLGTILLHLNNFLKHSEDIKKAVQEKLTKINEEFENLKSQNETLKASIKEIAITSSRNEQESFENQVTLQQLKSDIDLILKEKTELEEMCEILKISNKALKDDLDLVKNTSVERMEKVGESFDILRLENELQSAQTDVLDLREQCKQIKTEKNVLLESQKLLENEKKELWSNMEFLRSKNIELEDQLKQKKIEYELLSSISAKNEAELTLAKDKVAELSEQVVQLVASSSAVTSSDESLKREIISLGEESKNEIASYSAQITHLETDNVLLKKKLSVMKNDFESLEKHYSALKITFDKTELEFQKLKKELVSSRQELETERKMVATLQQEIVSHTEELKRLQELKEYEAAKHAEITSRLRLESNDGLQKLFDSEIRNKHMKVKDQHEALMQTFKSRVSFDKDCEEKIQKLSSKLQSIEKCLTAADCEGASSEERICSLLNEKISLAKERNELKKEVEILVAEKENQAFILTEIRTKMFDLEKERDASITSLNELKDKLQEMTGSLAIEENNKISLISEIKVLKDEIIALKKSNDEASVVLNDIRKEKLETKTCIERLKDDCNQRSVELIACGTEIANNLNGNQNIDRMLQIEDTDVENTHNVEVDRLKLQIRNLESEVRELSKTLSENEAVILEAKQQTAISPDIEEEWKNKEISYLQKIEELKIAAGITETAKIEEMKRDIAFLNSIIAEQFKKEQDMKKQIAILNGIPANQIFMELQRKTFRDLPPRLYCDMCEVFDLHDTTDCPEQALDIMKNGIHENVHKVRPSPRAYCEECEEFGHDIECCQKRQTEKSEAKDCTF